MIKAPLLAAATLASLVALPVHAQATAPSGTAAFDGLLTCRTLAEDAARLACFDRAAAAVDRAKAAGDLKVVDREAVKSAKRSLFGFTLPRIDLFGGKADDDAPEIKEITSTVATVRDRGHAMYSVVLAEGSAWSFTEEMAEAPRRGDTITIKRGTLGSYRGQMKSRPAARMKRDR